MVESLGPYARLICATLMFANSVKALDWWSCKHFFGGAITLQSLIAT